MQNANAMTVEQSLQDLLYYVLIQHYEAPPIITLQIVDEVSQVLFEEIEDQVHQVVLRVNGDFQ